MAQPKLRCPVCGKQQGIPLLWGIINPAMLERFLGQTVMFARANVDDAQSDAECLDCGSQWCASQQATADH